MEYLESPDNSRQKVPRQSEIQRTLSFQDNENQINSSFSPNALQGINYNNEESSPYKQPFESEPDMSQQEIQQEIPNSQFQSLRPTVVQFPDIDFNQLSECQQRISCLMKTNACRPSFSLRLSCLSELETRATMQSENDFTELEKQLISKIIKCRTSIIDEMEELDQDQFSPIRSRIQSQHNTQQIFEREQFDFQQ